MLNAMRLEGPVWVDIAGHAADHATSKPPPADAAHLSLRVFANATHAFDGLDGVSEVKDALAHRGKGGIMRIRPNLEARGQPRIDLVGFYTAALFQGTRLRDTGVAFT